MDQNTLNLVLFAEQMAALLAKTIVDLKNVISGSNTQTVDQILADADATYQGIIAAAKTKG
jgi:ABC-type xylose transport system substrate-binding protein